jgi:error-prone DNA polymerase
MLEPIDASKWFCNNCSHDWDRSHEKLALQQGGRSASQRSASQRSASLSGERNVRFKSLDDFVARAGLRRDELVTLADVGALNAFGYDRRSALWQAERAIRPSGELFQEEGTAPDAETAAIGFEKEFSASVAGSAVSSEDEAECPLKPMTEAERLVADYAGMGLSTGRHPMALRRDELAMRGILRASDLHTARQGRRVRIAGMVITRQRPGTAKGFVFLTLEDETGIANIIVRPDLFARDRLVIVEEPFLIVDGVLQQQDGVTSIRAEQVHGMRGIDVDFDAHDFY